MKVDIYVGAERLRKVMIKVCGGQCGEATDFEGWNGMGCDGVGRSCNKLLSMSHCPARQRQPEVVKTVSNIAAYAFLWIHTTCIHV